jgi:hypothetical protein
MNEGDRAVAPSSNHLPKTASLSGDVQKKIASMGLVRRAGNIYECPSTKDFWAVKNGKIMRLTVTEVDNGESLKAAPRGNPSGFLSAVLNDLTF